MQKCCGITCGWDKDRFPCLHESAGKGIRLPFISGCAIHLLVGDVGVQQSFCLVANQVFLGLPSISLMGYRDPFNPVMEDVADGVVGKYL